jgi:hypothetical protein
MGRLCTLKAPCRFLQAVANAIAALHNLYSRRLRAHEHCFCEAVAGRALLSHAEQARAQLLLVLSLKPEFETGIIQAKRFTTCTAAACEPLTLLQ